MSMNPRQADSREVIEESVRSATNAGFEATRRVAEQATQAMGDAGRQGTSATDAMRQNAERTSEFWRSGTVIGRRIAEQSMEQFSRLFGLAGGDMQHTLHRYFHNIQAITDASAHMTDGLPDASAEWMALAQNSIEHNLDRVDALLGCRSIDQYVVVQTEFARDSLEAFLQTARRMSEISARSAEEAARRVRQASLASTDLG